MVNFINEKVISTKWLYQKQKANPQKRGDLLLEILGNAQEHAYIVHKEIAIICVT